jgi:ferredoxin
MKVAVDDERCAGHGVCVGLCPEVFDLGDDGYAVIKLTDVPEQFGEAVREAAQQCPTQAITVAQASPSQRGFSG